MFKDMINSDNEDFQFGNNHLNILTWIDTLFQS
jgi:hypothetical protein